MAHSRVSVTDIHFWYTLNYFNQYKVDDFTVERLKLFFSHFFLSNFAGFSFQWFVEMESCSESVFEQLISVQYSALALMLQNV